MQWTVAIGVDTHKDVHVAVALDGFGEQLGSHEVETTEAGYRSLLSWALGLGQPVFAVEGAGSYGAGLLFAAATGLRPSELFGIEQRDVDRQAGVVYVRRAYANGRIKHTKTRLSTRAVPLQAKALDALDRLPASDNPILFPNMRDGRIDFRIFGRKHWRPAQTKAGIDPVRGLYDLRHTYATFALRAGVPVFAVSRFMGTSIAMIDRHYGHLANDSREHAVALLDALALERAVDAAWTSTRTPRKPVRKTVAASRSHRPRRAVDARWTPLLVPVASTDYERS